MLLAACEAPPPAPPDYTAREVVELQRWDIACDGAPLGQLIRFEIRDRMGPIRFYRVVDRHGRWLGHATDAGRFSRRVPFEEQEQDLGVLSLERGAALLFEAAAPVELRPIARDADFDRSR